MTKSICNRWRSWLLSTTILTPVRPPPEPVRRQEDAAQHSKTE
jgi:hypothetical protein